MRRLLLQVSHHQTCGEDVVLHYEVRVTTASEEVVEFVGRFSRLAAQEYELEVGRIPPNARSILLTPDSRLTLTEAQEPHAE